jgi:large subunit ribosomal protein L25
MEKTVLPVKLRQAQGKGAARSLRREGLIPGILYGKKQEAAKVKVDPKELRSVLTAAGADNVPFQISVEGGAPLTVMLKELQREPVSRRPLHADFWELTKGQKLHVEVAIRVTGTAVGVAKGGVVSLVMRDLPVECLPEDIPEHIDIDVSALDIGHSIHVRDLELARNLKPTVDPDQTVVTCAPPTVAKEEAAPAAAEAAVGEEAAKKEEEKS